MVTINRETITEFNELLEDVVEYICTEHSNELISGETLWKAMEVYASVKQMEFSGLVK